VLKVLIHFFLWPAPAMQRLHLRLFFACHCLPEYSDFARCCLQLTHSFAFAAVFQKRLSRGS
jgi:hypothetical protein